MARVDPAACRVSVLDPAILLNALRAQNYRSIKSREQFVVLGNESEMPSQTAGVGSMMC